MKKKYTDYAHCEKSIDLSTGIPEQDFLTVLCWDYEAAARFVLDWADSDTEAAKSFIGGFLWRVLSELHIFSPPMVRKNPNQSGFQTPGTSVCSVAFQRFCELLHEDPNLVRLIRETPPYSSLQRSEDFLAQRNTNWFSLTRDIYWQASDSFKDPEPIPQDIRAAFRRQLEVQDEQDRAKRLRDAGARDDARKVKKAERLIQATVTQEVNKQKSKQRRVLRDNFLSKSVHDQLVTLATDTRTPLTAFPLNPLAVPDDALIELDDSLLGCLQERAATRWESWWKDFAERIGAIRNHRLSLDVFHCKHCDRLGLPFVRDSAGKFYRFPPTIGASGPAPLLFVGINPRVSPSNRTLHDAIVQNLVTFEALRRNRVGTREYIGRAGLEKHYLLHVNVAQALFPGRPFDSIASVTELHFCASTSSARLPPSSSECADRYLGAVLESVCPVVVFAVGRHVERTLRSRSRSRGTDFDLTWPSGKAPVIVLPHPNSFGPKRKGFDRAVREARRHL